MIRHGVGGWEKPQNRLLSVAVQVYRRSIHSPCGQPMEKAFSGDINGWLQVDWVRCQACAAREQARTELGRDDERHGAEWIPIPVDHFPHGTEEKFRPWAFTPRPLDD